LAYWLHTEERVEAVDYPRRQYYGDTGRPHRVSRIAQRRQKMRRTDSET
jgi:hypothetical protein